MPKKIMDVRLLKSKIMERVDNLTSEEIEEIVYDLGFHNIVIEKYQR